MTCSLAHVWGSSPAVSTRDNGFLCGVTCTPTYTPDTSRTISNTFKIYTVYFRGRKRERNTNLFNKYNTYTQPKLQLIQPVWYKPKIKKCFYVCTSCCDISYIFIYLYIYNLNNKTISNVLLLGQIKPDIHLYITVPSPITYLFEINF